MHPVYNNGEHKIVITLRSDDGSISCGGRFKNLPLEIGSTYKDLVNALNEAIDKEGQEKGESFITDKTEIYQVEELNFDDLMTQFNDIVGNFVKNMSQEDFEKDMAPKIKQITERYLGRGKKVSQCTRDQVEMLSLIVSELKEIK